jgi:hypothetical protein
MHKNEMSGSVSGNVVQAASIGRIIYAAENRDLPVPAQLPPVPRYFTSRRRELATLDEWARDNPDQLLIAVLSGAGGVGKTMLALRWLHDNREDFPDGQLYLDLGAFSQVGPVAPEDALEWFLVALGLHTTQIPDGLPQRAALYRSVTARRGVSILLDNAFSAAQVRALLPSSPRSAVVVTSRHRLSGLRINGARFLDLDPLDVRDSVALLKNVVGDERLDAERTEAEELARLCGGLPIALSVVGARLSARPHRSLRSEVGEIRTKDRLGALEMDDEVSVSGIFDVSYAALPPGAARLYRLGALHPGSVFGLGAAAAIAGTSEADVEETVYSLVENSLLTEVDDRRFRYHDLLALHARQLAERLDDETDRAAAVRRVVEWYLDRAVAADRTLHPTRRRVGPRSQGPLAPLFSDRDDALRWFLLEHRNLVLAVQAAERHDWPDLVWEFCEALWTFLSYAPGDWPALFRAGVAAAARCGHVVAETRMRILLGTTLTAQRRYDEAIDEVARALRQAEETGNRYSTATALVELATAWHGKGDARTALDKLRRAKLIREEIDTARSVLQCQRQIGVLLTELGDYEHAVAELTDALEKVAEHDIERTRVLTALGTAHRMAGNLADAAAPLSEAVALAAQLRSDLRRAEAHVALGELALSSADVERAREHLATARDLYVGLGSPWADDVAHRLSRLEGR